jgi:hypothetical protein
MVLDGQVKPVLTSDGELRIEGTYKWIQVYVPLVIGNR